MDFPGLTSAAAKAALERYGYNEITEKKDSLVVKIAKHSISFISGMLLLAAMLSFVSHKVFDGCFILVLLVLNVAITVWQEQKADTAIESLNKNLATLVRVMRDGAWQRLPSRLLVPNDVIELKAGDVIPADARVLKALSASVNEAALTGESLPKDKKTSDTIYSGSFVASGIITAVVSATGSDTSFGKTLAKVDTSRKRSSLERDILRISRFLSLLSLLAVILLTALLAAHHAPWLEIIELDLSLVIAGIPISLPTVMTLIIAFGVIALAGKQVVVRRLSSLEDLANTDLLLTDKTGTLTQNKIHVDDIVVYDAKCAPEEAARLAALVALQESDNLIDRAILAKSPGTEPVEVLQFTPADSVRKRSTLTYRAGGKPVTLTLGAPQVVASLSSMAAKAKKQFDSDIEGLAARGYRTLALARASGEKEENMKLLSIFSLSDVLRSDAAGVVRFLTEQGIGVVMLTGDNRAIAREVAGKLAIPGSDIATPEGEHSWSRLGKSDFERVRAFAEILPDDKYEIVKAAKRYYTVAANGDGVNDLPAIKEASVGFAVRNAVDALKGAADIVLLTDGIAVMRDAIIEGRTIFARLYAYSLYRISESFRLIVTIAILGLLTGSYPLVPLQIILIALLNDIPIISLAFNRVELAPRPSSINVRDQFTRSTVFGMVGVVNSLLLFAFATYVLRLPFSIVETLFFLKLTVSGHMLIYVAHTKRRWYQYLPSRSVIIATSLTQAVATLLALTGFLMPAAVSWPLALLIWVWSFIFMQLSELTKPRQSAAA